MENNEDSSLDPTRLFTLLNLDEEFYKNPSARVINNETLVSKKLSKEFTDAIFSNSDGELGFVPTCQCGQTRGVMKQGLICPICGTEVSSEFVDSLSHMSWIGIPDQFPGVLHPIWYMILKSWTPIGRKNLSVLDIILNPDEDVPDDLIPHLKGRGMRYFYEHCDEVLQMLTEEYPRTAKKPATKNIKVMLRHYKSCMFTRHLPILHSSLHPLKCNGGTLNYADNTSKEILSAIVDLSMVTFKVHSTQMPVKTQDRVLFTIYSKVIKYYQLILTEKLGKKQALLRKHDFGSRVYFSGRSVITPHEKIVGMDEIILPWTMMVNGLKLPLLNLLMSRGHYTLENALNKFMTALVNYDEEIDGYIRALIDEFPEHRMPIALGRNPER